MQNHNISDATASRDAPITGGVDRLSEPVGQAQKPRLPFPVVGIGASAGGLEAFIEFFRAMPGDSGIAFVVIQHLPPERESMMVEILSKHTPMLVRPVEDGLAVEPNCVYVIRPGRTLTIHDGRLHLSEPLEKRGHQHPIDDFFRSLAEEQRERAIAVVLSGMGSNGSAGAAFIKAVGGLCIAQEPDSAKFDSMPRHLLESGMADFVLKAAEIPERLLQYTRHPYATGEWSIENPIDDRQPLQEILALLRTRTKHDFSGYKTPTLLRRVERRMGMHQIVSTDKYLAFLRRNPTELSALTDDLMIHVTGFFRDPEVWKSLQETVITPLMQARDGGPIRAWVTACSSGEEAYTLAMLLMETAEREQRHFDIKIFATDIADRSLTQARIGLYAAGIVADISPERLDRFFEKEDAMYRVKQEIRELVVFATQNVLTDPPFSRLDICSCRNLLIYLRPETQRHALELLHFGLREGGTLLLGTSENVASDELFEAIDKRNRIYRRVGPTRHGSVEFPLLKTVSRLQPDHQPSTPSSRASLAAATNKALLDRYSPPSVVIDSNQRILYFHGHTERYLDQPRGEPTRDLLTLARESIRSILRAAVIQAIAEGQSARVADGWVRLPNGQRQRTVISVSPIEERGKSTRFLISFEAEVEISGEDNAAAHSSGERSDGDFRELAAELQRVRDELESTVDELHTRNEDLKAAHEEATSVNEEMQSTNEELETSKEELQSLNEELVTVNTQLQHKMQELESSTNDLSSLLSSTSIAVIFLDTTFRIRRFTPAVLDLIDLIPADIGRPIKDLARKFDDAELLHDAQRVLESLVPIETEVTSANGHVYTRRALPYRTMDNHIDGVVLTFVDITERAGAVRALRESEEQHRLILDALKEYGIFMLDASGYVTTWTTGAARVLHYTSAQAIGKHFSEFLAPGAATAREIAAREVISATLNGTALEDGWHLRHGGQRFWGTGVLAALRDSRGTLLGFVKVMRDNTEQKINEEALRQAKLAAESANDAKDRFLANVSHELRTPLSAILLWSSLLQDQDNIAPAQLKHALTAINRSAEEQRDLIEDLVDTSRIAAGKLVLDIQNAHLASIVERGVAGSQKLARDKNVSINLNMGGEVDGARVDAPRLQQVVTNLVGNAVKFTPAGGKVEVSLHRSGDNVEIVVSDDGLGISAEFLPHIFDRFTQMRGASTRSNSGLGLGLAIVSQIVELHGGSVKAESAGVGHGSTFTVCLHLPPTNAPDATSGETPTRQIAGRLDGIHILLVEDVQATRVALEAVLREAGATVASVEAAAQAYEEFRAQRPDVIVSDLGLPDVDGFELITHLRSIERNGHLTPVPAVALTAFAGAHVRRKAVESGFQRCLTKPIHPLPLIEVVQRLVTTPDAPPAA